ncbi:hypothetical protein AN901_203549 [Pseudomonas syringae pv. theae]|nr:hypothetical protein AN901_203549 [Pseudomonas syringae pv. theae]
MGKISARFDQLLNDAVGVCRRSCVLRCPGISRHVQRAPCLCVRTRRCCIGRLLRRMSFLCTCMRHGGSCWLLKPDGHSSLRRWRHTLRHPLPGLARQRPGSQKHFASISRLRRRCIRRRGQARTVRGARATAGSVCLPRYWLGVCVATKISARWSRSINTHHMLILSGLPPADRITRKISAGWQQSRKEFHLTLPYTPRGTYTTQPDSPSKNTNKA